MSSNFQRACFDKWLEIDSKCDQKPMFPILKNTIFNKIRGWFQKKCHFPSLNLIKHTHTPWGILNKD